MKVSEAFEESGLDLDNVWVRADENTYWLSAANFIEEKWDKYVDTMSIKQQEWMHKIIKDLED